MVQLRESDKLFRYFIFYFLNGTGTTNKNRGKYSDTPKFGLESQHN